MQKYRIATLAVLLTLVPQLAVADCAVKTPPTICFSPHGGCRDEIIRFIGTADNSIRVAAYNFTSKRIADALVAAHKRGIDVQVVVDQRSNKVNLKKLNKRLKAVLAKGGMSALIQATSTKADDLITQGVLVRYDGKHRIMHDKTIVIDGEGVEMGSYNFTDNAEDYNAENARIDWCAPALAKLYAKDWDKHWVHSK